MDDAPPPPYFANCGPLEGPVRDGTLPSAIGVSLDGDRPWQSDGIAFGVSCTPHWRGPVATWRLVIGKAAVPGVWVLVSRRFIPLEEFEEREAIRDLG